MCSLFSDRFHLLLGSLHLASLGVVDGIDTSSALAFSDFGISHLSHQVRTGASSSGGLVFSDCSKADGLALITKSESTELGKSGVLLKRHWLLEVDTNSGLSVGANVLGLLLCLGITSSVIFSSDKDLFDHAFISEGVHVHHAGVSTRHDRFVRQ